MNTLVIEKQTGGYFKFTLNGDTANAITSIQNDLLAVGTQLHFKTGNGANIIKEQFIYPADLTVISGGTFTFTTVAQVWNKLIEIGYFAWLGGGGTGGVDRFDELLDTFSYTGKAGKVVVVDNSELKLVPVTFYNKRLFTELEDTPSSLVPNKMVVVNEAGTSLILQDQPAQPEQLLNSVGYFDYNDLITHTFPLSAVANTALKLTNDTNGANTSTSENPYGVSYVWDNTSNAFNFSELSVGDTVDIRIHVQITTTTSNQKVTMSAKFGIGSVSEFTNAIYENTFKSSGLHEISFVAPFYMGSTYITDYPAELYLTTDASGTVIVDGWYIRILRKNINIITVDYTVPDATNLVKGIVRLGGDLAGTADSPTVPGLTTKVPTTRTIGTTSPLLGGGALSSNLTLSIQQGGSTQNGYLSSTDWLRFDEAHNDRIVSAGVTGTTTKTLTLNQHDGGTVTASWTDNNTDAVTSVFGRTGAVVSATGDYTTTQVTEGTNLYYTNTRVSANTDVAANTAARHSAVTIGTANGLSLASQTLSLALASTSTTGALSSTNWNTFNGKQNALSGTGIVKSTAGVISYLTDNTANWDSAYNDKVTSATVTGTTTKTLTLTQQDGGTLTTSWTDNNTDAVTSVFGRTGAVIAVSGDYTTSLVTEGTNLYYTEGRVSTNTDVAANTAARHSAVTLGTSTNGLSLTGQQLTLALSGTSSTGALSSTDWNTFNGKQNALTNPVTGTGATNTVPKFTGTSAIGNSIITDSGAIVDILANSSASIDTRLSVSSTGNGGAGRGTAILMKVPGSSSSANGVKINAYTVGGAVTAQSTDLSFDVGLSGTLVERMRIASTGAVTINNLAGTGSRMVIANATGVLSTQAIPLGTITGTGSADRIAKFTGTTAIADSIIYETSGRVGIGAASTFGKLELKSASFGTQAITLYTEDLTQNPRAFIEHITASGSQRVNFKTNYSTGTTFANWTFENGSVGIGTISPAEKLDVNGSVRVQGAFTLSNYPNGVLSTNETGLVKVEPTFRNLSLGESFANVINEYYFRNGYTVSPTDAGYQYAKLIQQNLLNSASLLLIPQAVKPSLLATNKPNIDLDVVRATTATRVNSSGLIESSAVNVPRLDYTNSSCPSILVEPQRTNLLTYSEQFNDTSWNKFEVSVTTNTTISPDGNTTADSVIENSASATQHRIGKFAISLTSGTTYTISAYVKSGIGSRNVQLGGSGTSAWIRVYFDLTNGTVGSQVGGTGTITNVGNGWYRITATGVCDLTGNNTFYLANTNGTTIGSETYNGDGTSSIIWWGAQLEAGANATSYIPTTTASVTRNADVISKTGISSLIGQTEGVFYAEIVTNDDIISTQPISLNDGTTSNRILLYIDNSKLYTSVTTGGTSQALISSSTILKNTKYKLAIGYKSNDIVFYVNGILIGTDTVASIPSCSAFSSHNGVSTSFYYSKLNSVAIWKTRLTNAELATLTTL